MATLGRTALDIGYTFEKARTIGTTRERVTTLADSERNYTNGTGTGKFNVVHSSRRSLTAGSATDDIDLTLLEDPSGTPCAFSIIRFIYIKNREASGGTDLRVGGAGTNAWIAPWKDAPSPTGIFTTVEAGGEWFLSSPIDGMRVITGERLLRIVHATGSGAALDYDLIVCGE